MFLYDSADLAELDLLCTENDEPVVSKPQMLSKSRTSGIKGKPETTLCPSTFKTDERC
jgi:hypothetical protein